MANGHSVAAVAGRREVMTVGSIDRPGMERTFLLSTTHGAEMPGLGAFIETARIYNTENVTGHLWAFGRQLKAGLTEVAAHHGLERRFVIDGPAISLNYLTLDTDGKPSMALRTLFAQEMIARGVLMPWIAVAQSHGAAELALTLEAADGALGVLRKAIDGRVEDFLAGPVIRPVFRSHN
jgi:glutamate-1-semialdehyde 2,1-aminomutase